ncbi:MAG: hypothetical protein E6J92_09535 [Methanobacteriota archaeon]|nr:MAG: hypothetical protein E6K00_07430 [Euryarchaeota archaeon]TLZ97208.1 MAG: hypothetical protein E6J96_06500 [Euryarchaeota archaeon]TMA00443.1 MAG: hypothetical protein E6J92_09535 [Euryarchaeota archaeon]
MASTLELALLAVALILNGLLAGASLDKAITQLPARRKIGLRAMAEYHRATDLGPGLFLYPILGLGAPLLTWAAAVALFQGGDVSSGVILLIALGAVLSIGHVITTAMAAPNLLRLRKGILPEKELGELYQRFGRWSGVRSLLQVLTFVVVVIAAVSAL